MSNFLQEANELVLQKFTRPEAGSIEDIEEANPDAIDADDDGDENLVSRPNVTGIQQMPENPQGHGVPVSTQVVDDRKLTDVHSLVMKESIDALFSGVELSEDVKESLGTLFEAAVADRVVSIKKELSEAVEVALTEKTKELEQVVEAYTDHTAETFMQENKLAVEAGFKVELAENFVRGLKELFEANSIQLDENKVDVYKELQEKYKDLETKYSSLVEQNQSYKNYIDYVSKEMIVQESVKNLSDVAAEKVKSLAEEILFENEDSFRKKLEVIKESYVNKAPVKSSFEVETLVEDEQPVKKETNSVYGQYANFVSKEAKKFKI